MVERGISLRRAGDAIAPGGQCALDATKRRDVLGVVPLVELRLMLRRDVHRYQEQCGGVLRGNLVARKKLLAFVPYQSFAEPGCPLRPRRRIRAGDRYVGRAMQDADSLEVVGRDRDLGVLDVDPALGVEEARNAQA